MNPALAFEIAQLALSLLAPGQAHEDFQIEETLLEIIEKGAPAYQQHTGEPLDPSLIRAEEPI
jgi:hypothetical protein